VKGHISRLVRADQLRYSGSWQVESHLPLFRPSSKESRAKRGEYFPHNGSDWTAENGGVRKESIVCGGGSKARQHIWENHIIDLLSRVTYSQENHGERSSVCLFSGEFNGLEASKVS